MWLLVALVVPTLAGCAGIQPPDRPEHFPLHAADHPLFDLHWRLDRPDGWVRAAGLVEAARVSGIGYVVLELRGLDRDGRVVSHAFGRTFRGRLDRWDTQPFVIRFRPSGREERFELTVWTYGWANDGDSGRDD